MPDTYYPCNHTTNAAELISIIPFNIFHFQFCASLNKQVLLKPAMVPPFVHSNSHSKHAHQNEHCHGCIFSA